MLETPPTHFAWSAVAPMIGYTGFPPPREYGKDELCWLCGGSTGGVGWPWNDAIKPTFTNHNRAAVLTSQTICQPCAAMQSKETWEAYVAARPNLSLKTGHAVSWRCYSHAFMERGHEVPMRTQWRDWLLDPPQPPFLFAISTSGQKHTIFRGRVAMDRELFPVQLEEELLWVHRQWLAQATEAVEALYRQGVSKQAIASGEYPHAKAKQIGLRRLRQLDEAVRPWRNSHYMELAQLIATKEDG